MNRVGGCGDPRLVEGNGHDLVTAGIAHVTNVDGQITARLPLDVEGVIHGVGQLVRPVVGGKRKELVPAFDPCFIGQITDDRLRDCPRAAVARSVPQGFSSVLEQVGIKPWYERGTQGTDLRVHERWSLVDAERPRRGLTRGVAGREIGEKFATIVIDSRTAPDHDLVVKPAWESRQRPDGEQCPIAGR